MYTLALISNIFSGDGMLIMLVLLLLFGAKRLPELAKGLGSAVREFSKAKDEIEHEITRPAAPAPRIEAPQDTQPHAIASESSPTPVAAPAEEPQSASH
jgi:sec-independent protein translocase protein TatA